VLNPRAAKTCTTAPSIRDSPTRGRPGRPRYTGTKKGGQWPPFD
jgi:hypothetical protein